jgi:hypothetical protein
VSRRFGDKTVILAKFPGKTGKMDREKEGSRMDERVEQHPRRLGRSPRLGIRQKHSSVCAIRGFPLLHWMS